MSNEEIVALLELTVKLLELHDENEFKIKNLSFAARALDKETADLKHSAAVLNERAVELGGVGDEVLLVRGWHRDNETVYVGHQLRLEVGRSMLAVRFGNALVKNLPFTTWFAQAECCAHRVLKRLAIG